MEDSVRLIESKLSPNGFLGVHCVVDLFAQCKTVRALEESRALWSPCYNDNHGVCGIISGIHLSTADVGWTVRNIQADIFEVMFGRDGLFDRSIISSNFVKSISEVVDEVDETGSGYCFYCDPRNEEISNLSWKVVEQVLQAQEVANDMDLTRQRLKTLLSALSDISVQLSSVIQLAGGMCGRAAEIASAGIENNANGQMRSLFLFNGQLTFVPRFTKTSWRYSTSMTQLVSRHMDDVTSFLFKCFGFLCAPLRSATRRALHMVFNKTGCSSAEARVYSDGNYADSCLINDISLQRRVSTLIAEQWKRYGIPMTSRQYRQWCGGYAKDRECTDSSTESVMKYLCKVVSIPQLMHLQAGHSASVAKAYYGRDVAGIDPGGSLDARHMYFFLAASKKWHIDIGFMNWDIRTSGILSGHVNRSVILVDDDECLETGKSESKKRGVEPDGNGISSKKMRESCRPSNVSGPSKPIHTGGYPGEEVGGSSRCTMNSHQKEVIAKNSMPHLLKDRGDDGTVPWKYRCFVNGQVQDGHGVGIGKERIQLQLREIQCPPSKVVEQSIAIHVENVGNDSPNSICSLEKTEHQKTSTIREVQAVEAGDLNRSSEMGPSTVSPGLGGVQRRLFDEPAKTLTTTLPRNGSIDRNINALEKCSTIGNQVRQVSNGEPPTDRRAFLLKLLRRGCGKAEATFLSSTQEAAMRHIIERNSDVLIIDRTGGGKSSLIFGPTFEEKRMTVVIVPLMALLNDLLRRASKLGVQTFRVDEIWNGPRFPNGGLVVASAEQTGRQEFKNFTVQCCSKEKDRISRIVIDEAHVTILGRHYRYPFRAYNLIRPYGVRAPLIMMTSTCPRRMESEMISAHGASAECKVIRGNLHRQNIALKRYCLQNGREDLLLSALVTSSLAFVTSPQSEGRHIISVLSRGMAETIHSSLSSAVSKHGVKCKVLLYHSHLDDEEKRNSLQGWNEGSSVQFTAIVMVCTSGFTVGIDAPNVRSLIITGAERSIIEAWQSIGRLGRDGLPATVLFLWHESYLRRANVTDVCMKVLLQEYGNWMREKSTCLVMYAEEYLGSPKSTVRTCLENGEDICSNCAGEDFKINFEHICAPGKSEDISGISPGSMPHGECRIPKVTMKSSSMKTSIRLMRKVGTFLRRHCIPCVLENNFKVTDQTSKYGNGQPHNYLCYNKRCFLCLSSTHGKKNCKSVELPVGKRVACRFCYIGSFGHVDIHEGRGTHRQEFGSPERCPFESLVSISIAIFGLKETRIDLDSFLRSVGHPSIAKLAPLQYFNWLVQDTRDSLPGILVVTRFVQRLFNVSDV